MSSFSISPVKITSIRNGSETAGEIKIESWTRPERTRRALKFLLCCWGGGIVCVIFPLVHFFLVPGLLLAGPIAAYFIVQQVSVITGGEGTCPECEKPLLIARSGVKFPISEVCGACKCGLKVDLQSE